DWAATKHGVRRFRASVGPWNKPSLGLVRGLGFRRVGVQIDEVDGKELGVELHPPMDFLQGPPERPPGLPCSSGRGGRIENEMVSRHRLLASVVAALAVWAASFAAPALAATSAAPRIKYAIALDANGNDHIDGLRLIYDQRVRHVPDAD